MCISINVAKEVYMSQKYDLKKEVTGFVTPQRCQVTIYGPITLWEQHKPCKKMLFPRCVKSQEQTHETYEESFNSNLANPPSTPLAQSDTAQCHQERSLLMASPWQGREKGRVYNVLIFGRLPEELVLVCLIWSTDEISIVWMAEGHWKQERVGTACCGTGGPEVPERENECGLGWLGDCA